MPMEKIYLRHETTTDEIMLQAGLNHLQDVVAYRDIDCTKLVSRWSWNRTTRPRPHQGRILINCIPHQAVWMQQREDCPVSLLRALKTLATASPVALEQAGLRQEQIEKVLALRPVFEAVDCRIA